MRPLLAGRLRSFHAVRKLSLALFDVSRTAAIVVLNVRGGTSKRYIETSGSSIARTLISLAAPKPIDGNSYNATHG